MALIKTLGYKRILIFIVLALIITLVEYLYIISRQYFSNYQQSISLNQLCVDSGGTWLRDFKECENVSRQWCEVQTGSFDECASACRHTNSEICTMQCVGVCSFQEKNETASSSILSIGEKKNEQFIYKDEIVLFNPLPGKSISSPLQLRGKARGSWFFEGSFPVILTNWDGLIISEGVATAETDWMTTDWVNFSAELNFDAMQLYKRGALILKKDNPSGLPQNDDAFEISLDFE